MVFPFYVYRNVIYKDRKFKSDTWKLLTRKGYDLAMIWLILFIPLDRYSLLKIDKSAGKVPPTITSVHRYSIPFHIQEIIHGSHTFGRYSSISNDSLVNMERK